MARFVAQYTERKHFHICIGYCMDERSLSTSIVACSADSRVHPRLPAIGYINYSAGALRLGPYSGMRYNLEH